MVERALTVGLGALEASPTGRDGADGCKGDGRTEDASTGSLGAPAWQPPPNDPRWAIDAMGTAYARTAHTVGFMGPGDRRVEVTVCPGDTPVIVGRALAAAVSAVAGAQGAR